MKIDSKTVNIPNTGRPTVEYVESKLAEMGINPLRWAIVKISKKYFAINCAYVKID